MSIRVPVPFLALASMLLVGCPEVDPEPTATDDPEPTIESPIVGDWISSGDDVSALLQSINTVEVTASFMDDGTYEVISTDDQGGTYSFTGTFTVDDTTTPMGIVVTQETPFQAVAEGIWTVEGTTLTYEVTQTSPDIGFAPPTVEGGFGSTTGPNLATGDNTQIFQAQ